MAGTNKTEYIKSPLDHELHPLGSAGGGGVDPVWKQEVDDRLDGVEDVNNTQDNLIGKANMKILSVVMEYHPTTSSGNTTANAQDAIRSFYNQGTASVSPVNIHTNTTITVIYINSSGSEQWTAFSGSSSSSEWNTFFQDNKRYFPGTPFIVKIANATGGYLYTATDLIISEISVITALGYCYIGVINADWNKADKFYRTQRTQAPTTYQAVNQTGLTQANSITDGSVTGSPLLDTANANFVARGGNDTHQLLVTADKSTNILRFTVLIKQGGSLSNPWTRGYIYDGNDVEITSMPDTGLEVSPGETRFNLESLPVAKNYLFFPSGKVIEFISDGIKDHSLNVTGANGWKIGDPDNGYAAVTPGTFRIVPCDAEDADTVGLFIHVAAGSSRRRIFRGYWDPVAAKADPLTRAQTHIDYIDYADNNYRTIAGYHFGLLHDNFNNADVFGYAIVDGPASGQSSSTVKLFALEFSSKTIGSPREWGNKTVGYSAWTGGDQPVLQQMSWSLPTFLNPAAGAEAVGLDYDASAGGGMASRHVVLIDYTAYLVNLQISGPSSRVFHDGKVTYRGAQGVLVTDPSDGDVHADWMFFCDMSTGSTARFYIYKVVNGFISSFETTIVTANSWLYGTQGSALAGSSDLIGNVWDGNGSYMIGFDSDGSRLVLQTFKIDPIGGAITETNLVTNTQDIYNLIKPPSTAGKYKLTSTVDNIGNFTFSWETDV